MLDNTFSRAVFAVNLLGGSAYGKPVIIVQ